MNKVLEPFLCLKMYLMPFFGVDVIELCTGEDLILQPQTSSDQDTCTGLQLHIDTGMVTPRGQHHRQLGPGTGWGLVHQHCVQRLCGVITVASNHNDTAARCDCTWPCEAVRQRWSINPDFVSSQLQYLHRVMTNSTNIDQMSIKECHGCFFSLLNGVGVELPLQKKYLDRQ